MLAILASAKTLDFSRSWQAPETTQPEFLARAKPLLAELKKLTPAALGKLLGVSPKLAALNAERVAAMSFPFTPANAKPAILAYQGEVFKSMRSTDFSTKQLAVAQRSLRILSGLYGPLRALDLIQPYRLEMATPLSGPSWSDLYDYWREQTTAAIDRDAQQDDGVIVNLASQEYSAAVQRDRLGSRWLDIAFKQDRRGKVELIPILAKRARGLMARFLVDSNAFNLNALKEFREEGYRFSPALSSEDAWVFVRQAG